MNIQKFRNLRNQINTIFDKLEVINEMLNDAGVTIVTMDGSYEQLQKYGVSGIELFQSTLSCCDEDIDDDEDEGFDITM